MSGKIIPTNRIEWQDAVLGNEEAFVNGFKDLGVDQKLIDENLELYRIAEGYSPVRTLGYGAHAGAVLGAFLFPGIGAVVGASLGTFLVAKAKAMKTVLKTIFKIYDYRVEQTITKQVKIPLFRFSSPQITGSKVTYREMESEQTEGGWSISVLGTGMGATQTFKVKHSAEFESTNGAYKLIFVPVTLQISLVSIYMGSECVGRGLRAEMCTMKGEYSFNKGIASIPESIGSQDIPQEDVEGHLFPLAEDTSGGIATYTQTWVDANEISVMIGIEAFDIKGSSKAVIKQERELELKFALPTGRNYLLKPIKDGHGLVWKME